MATWYRVGRVQSIHDNEIWHLEPRKTRDVYITPYVESSVGLIASRNLPFRLPIRELEQYKLEPLTIAEMKRLEVWDF